MDKQIPIYFDSVVVSSPIQEIKGNSSIGRLKVRVFTKYANRNGSYITDEVADQLIQSATQGITPVVGFFDPETKTWASHTGPTLANGYGYVEKFIGWEPFQDTDGIIREYAVFSVILFTDYFDEARNIVGQNQSMELDPNSITGDWATIGDNEYFVYTTAKMLGFCVIGAHEPCFSVSSFFSKNDDDYKSQYEKFSSLLFNLKAQVEEAEKNCKGGEKPMNEFENQEQVNLEEKANVIEESQVQESETPQNFEEHSEIVEEANQNIEENKDEDIVEEDSTSEVEENTEINTIEFERLQQEMKELQNSFEQLQNEYNVAKTRVEELEQFQSTTNTELESLRNENSNLKNSITNYESIITTLEENRKNSLLEKYEKIISDTEEINVIKGSIKDFSYDELESKLAILYANQQLAGSEENRVPLPEPSESQFALLMKKYRKN